MNHRSIWNRRIPPIFSILILIVGLVVTGWFVTTGIVFTGRAAPGNMPQHMSVANITDRSFTVTYTTSDTVLGTVSYSDGIVAVDDRDQKSGQPTPHRVHVISVRNLKPETTYSFTISSGGKQFTDNGKPFSVKTGAHLQNTSSSTQTITGKVITPDGNAPHEGIIDITPDGGQTLATLLKSDGTYMLSLQALRTNSLTDYLPLTPSDKLHLHVITESGEADVTVLASRTNPVGPITINNTYDFSVTNTKNDVSIASASGEQATFPVVGESETTINTKVQILSPKDNQRLTDQKPVFRGTAPPNSDVEITINADDGIQTNVIADRHGNWSYRPTTPLSSGQQTVTIRTRDQSGILKVLTQSFTVFTVGSLFTEPSVSPTAPTPTPTKKLTPSITPTPTITRSPLSKTPTPTTRIAPTVPPTSTPTAVPTQAAATPTPVVTTITPSIANSITPSQILPSGQTSISPQPSMAPTGSNDVLVYGVLGTIVFAIGITLFLMTAL